MQVPDDLLYTEEHEWVRQMGDSVLRIGITDYAQDQLGDVVFVELPEVGSMVSKDDILVEVESTKSVGEVYAPFPERSSPSTRTFPTIRTASTPALMRADGSRRSSSTGSSTHPAFSTRLHIATSPSEGRPGSVPGITYHLSP